MTLASGRNCIFASFESQNSCCEIGTPVETPASRGKHCGFRGAARSSLPSDSEASDNMFFKSTSYGQFTELAGRAEHTPDNGVLSTNDRLLPENNIDSLFSMCCFFPNTDTGIIPFRTILNPFFASVLAFCTYNQRLVHAAPFGRKFRLYKLLISGLASTDFRRFLPICGRQRQVPARHEHAVRFFVYCPPFRNEACIGNA